MRRTTVLLATAAALTLGLAALGGCSGSSDDGGSGHRSPTAHPAGHTKTHAPDDGVGGGTEDVADDGGSAGDAAACLVGTWTVDPQSVVESTKASMSLVMGGDAAPEITVTGEAVLTFAADGTVRTEYRQQVAEVSIAVADQQIRTRTTMDGVVTGRYEVSGDQLTMSDLDASGVTYESTGTVDGTPMDTGETDSMSLAAMELGGTVSYTCHDDTMEVIPTTAGTGSAFAATYHRS